MKKGRGNKAGQVRAVRTRLGKARKEKEKGRKLRQFLSPELTATRSTRTRITLGNCDGEVVRLLR